MYFCNLFSVVGLEITGKQQDNLDKWCRKNIRGGRRSKLVALFDYSRQRRGKKWRCYKKSALNPEGTAYDPEKKSKQYYTRHKKLTDLLGRRKSDFQFRNIALFTLQSFNFVLRVSDWCFYVLSSLS